MGSSQTTDSERADLVDAAFRDLCPSVLLAARKAGLGAEDGWDIVQRLGVVLVEKFDEYDPSLGSCRAWGAGIARNLLLDALRSRRVHDGRIDRLVSLERIPDTSLTPEESLRGQETLRAIVHTVHEDHREVFELDAMGCSGAEIGELLGVPRSTAEWKLTEARKDLRRALAKIREDRRSAMRLRALAWPFVLGWDRSRRAVRGALLVAMVPALLSVHLAGLPADELRVHEGWVAGRNEGDAAGAAAVPAAEGTIGAPPAATMDARPSPAATVDARVLPAATAHPRPPPAATVDARSSRAADPRGGAVAAERSGRRSWLVLREQLRSDAARPVDTGTAKQP